MPPVPEPAAPPPEPPVVGAVGPALLPPPPPPVDVTVVIPVPDIDEFTPTVPAAAELVEPAPPAPTVIVY